MTPVNRICLISWAPTARQAPNYGEKTVSEIMDLGYPGQAGLTCKRTHFRNSPLG